MRKLFTKLSLLMLCLLILLGALVGPTAVKAAAGGYTINWWSIDGGGSSSSSGANTLDSTIGQADAGPTMSGGAYALNGGFRAGMDWIYALFLPALRSN